MGGGASTSNVSSNLTTRPSNIRQLNHSVWEFYKPRNRDRFPPKVDVLFFHGAQLFNDDSEIFWKTWLSRDEKVVWPSAWLTQNLPRARILFISYDSVIRTMYHVMENLIYEVILSLTCRAGQECPVIFVGHSLGGIVIKNFLITCFEYAARKHEQGKEFKMFLQHCKAILFYATPNAGSRSMQLMLENVNGSRANFLKILLAQTARLSSKFSDLQYLQNPRWQTFGIGETRETTWRNFTGMVVSQTSARQDVEHIYWVDADHFQVSRAKNNYSCPIFTKLFDMIVTYYDTASPFQSNLPFSSDERYVPLENTLLEIDDAFKKSQVVVLYGDSGMGKSSLARHFALSFEKKHAQGASNSVWETSRHFQGPVVVLLSCGENANITDMQVELLIKFEELLINFRVIYPDRDWKNLPKSQIHIWFSETLNAIEDEEILVILDDVWEKELLENVLIRGPSLKYFITTRNGDLWRHNAEVIEIEAVDMKHGLRILANHAECEAHELLEDEADKLVKEVGFHPLALASLGTKLQRIEKQSVSDWRSLKQEFLKHLKGDDDIDHPGLFDTFYPKNVYAAMMLEVERLDIDTRTVLYAISIFQGKILESVVQLFLLVTQPDASNKFYESIDKLKCLSLVRRETIVSYGKRVSSEGDNKDANEDRKSNSGYDTQELNDVLVIHDLRRKVLSEDQRSKNSKNGVSGILSFLFEDMERFIDDPVTRSKYDLATGLCASFGQNWVSEMAKTRLRSRLESAIPKFL